jgi:hypothetical protein
VKFAVLAVVLREPSQIELWNVMVFARLTCHNGVSVALEDALAPRGGARAVLHFSLKVIIPKSPVKTGPCAGSIA